MTTTFRAGWLALALLCVTSSTLYSQTIAEDLQRADKQFDLYAYNLALKTYKQVLEKDANNGHALSRIADAYFQLNQPEEALSWYRRAVEQREPNSDVQLRYGKALMQKGDYQLARQQFLEYAALNDQANEAGRHYVEMCDFAIRTARKTAEYAARNEALNTSAADFSPIFQGSRVIYSSARTDIARQTQSKNNSDWSGSAYNQLFVTQRNPETGLLQKPTFLRNDLQNTYNESPVSFSADGKKVAFCRNNFINGTRQIADKGLNMSLYIADVNNGEWVNVKAFPYNGSDYATGFPCLIGNGNTIMFASNNPNSTTGGKGWDIYVSNLVNGEWSTPRNLGAPVNTTGNEVTPFYDGTNLYFSSDWHNGLGGLDVFRADVGKESVTNVQHLGPGINSSYDDYGFVYAAPVKIGYLTSNRPGGRGNEDIWQVVYNGNGTASAGAPPTSRSLGDAMRGGSTPANTTGQQPDNAFAPQTYSTESSIQSYYLLVTDAFGTPLPGVDVDLTECSGERGQTDSEGKFYFTAPASPLSCQMGLGKNGYENTRIDVQQFGRRNVTASLGLDNRQEFAGVVLDARDRQPLSDVVVEFTEKGKTIQTTTDVNGRYSLILAPGSTYVISYSKYGFADAQITTQPVVTGGSRQIQAVILALKNGNGNTAPATYSSTTRNPAPNGNLTAQENTVIQRWSTPATYSTPANTSRPNTTTLIQANQQPVTPPQFSGYAVQLSAFPANAGSGEASQYEALSKYGNIYTKSEEGKNKVRLGVFATKEEAQKALKEINKNQQAKGAFVVEEYDADKSLLLNAKQTAAATAPAQYSTPATTRGVATPADETICYAIQLSALSSDRPISINDYSALSDLGNVYGKMDNGSVKMRLGVWSTYGTAENTLEEVNKRGFKDAIIVTEKASDEKIKGYLIGKPAQPAATPATSTTPLTYSTQQPAATKIKGGAPAVNDGSKYYIRICALADPGRFEADQLEGAAVNGTVEKWPVGNTGLTAIMLAGYPTLEDARRDREKLHASGFKEAYVVRESKGAVTKVN